MNRLLIVKCSECGKATEVVDPRRASAKDIGETVRHAAAEGLVVELAHGKIDVGCDCIAEPEPPKQPRMKFRFNLRQIMLVIATIAILLTIFQHPISMLTDGQVFADKDVLKAASAPWSVYGWLFAGAPLINPKGLSKTPLVITMLLANVALAGMLPFLIGGAAISGFKRLWRMTLNDNQKKTGSKNDQQ